MKHLYQYIEYTDILKLMWSLLFLFRTNGWQEFNVGAATKPLTEVKRINMELYRNITLNKHFIP